MRIAVFGMAVLLCGAANAQRLQPGEVRVTIGSWKGTAEVDAFTRKERLILRSTKGTSGMVLRCMDGELSVGWIELSLTGSYDPGDRGQMSLRVGDDIIGPVPVVALSKFFLAGDLSQEQLTRIAKANREIGYQVAINGRSQTGGLGAIKTADVAARLRRSCSGEETISPENKAKLAPKGEGRIEEKAD